MRTKIRTALLPLLALAATGGAAQAQNGTALGIDTTSFDRSVRPQDDFFRFVNGTWMKNTTIPADRSSYGSFIQLRDASENALHTIVERAASAPNRAPGSDLQKVGDFYASFMDTARIESLGIEPLRPELNRIAAVSSKSQLPELFAALQQVGVSAPFSYGVQQDARNATRYIASLGQGGLGMPDRDYYLSQGAKFVQTRAAYTTYVETLLRLAGEPNAADAARGVVAFETALAGKQWDRVRNRDREATYNLRTVAQLDGMTPGFSWSRYVRATGTEHTPGVVVRQPDYVVALDSLLTATPLATIKQYETYKLVDEFAGSLSRPFADAQFAFRSRTLQGLQEPRPRWKRAVGSVEGALGEMVGRMYVAENFRPAQKARMEQLVANMMAAYREAIDELPWMSPATKTAAQEKLAHISVKIGYPDRWRDYSALEVRRGDLVGNLMRSARYSRARAINRLGQPVDRTEWGMTPQTVNAYYNASLNEIVFPAAILQPPFFNPEADDAVNYGAIGAVIGHEISHGFDDQGRRSDAYGNLRDWWTADDARAFESRATALADEYSSFSPVEGLNVNGRLTLGENIGDVSGIAVAYRAWKKSLNGREAPVIGGFTGEQRFFLGYGQIWRTLMREDAMRQQLLSDPHSPGEYRVNGVLRNIDAFYQAFGVREGDKMWVPADKRVKIW
ncbi:MAG TPA: M13 family metallopeptidase [Longimicrobiaceae bacterium]|nr:M13 family metallopeptidase [Longimicrobiaceae bacterium]